MKKYYFAMGILLLGLGMGARLAQAQYSTGQAMAKLPVTDLSAGMYMIKAEVAATESQRRQGLMFRRSLGTDEGMLFVYDQPVGLCMWMRNTRIPLSVAFIDANGRIINIENMKPHTTRSHCGKGPVRFALEMNHGWFEKKNIGPGSLVSGLERWR